MSYFVYSQYDKKPAMDKPQPKKSEKREKLPLISLYRLSKSKFRPPEYGLRSNKEWVREQILRMTAAAEEDGRERGGRRSREEYTDEENNYRPNSSAPPQSVDTVSNYYHGCILLNFMFFHIDVIDWEK